LAVYQVHPARDALSYLRDDMLSADIPPTPVLTGNQAWWRELTRYHWFVLIVAALAWMADCMDQQLFTLARQPAMVALLPPPAIVEGADTRAQQEAKQRHAADVIDHAGTATSVFLLGWGTGGLLFGFVGDMFGRARTMMITILLYSLFTGLSALSQTFWQFAAFRFLTGLGVGGEFAVGVALVAEVMPDRARPFALGLLQALSAIGNITAGLVGMVMGVVADAGWISNFEPWRAMFIVGAVPALLIVFLMRRLKEPEKWRQAALKTGLLERGRRFFVELFREKRWAGHAIVGMLLASAGIIGLWAIGFFTVDLQRLVFDRHLVALGLDPAKEVRRREFWAGMTLIVLNLGAAAGIYTFSYVTHLLGRKPTFTIAFLLAMLSTAFVFCFFNSVTDIFWMIPVMGFCQLSLFGGYAIYFPELFPTRLRSSGTSFCYNGARFVAAAGPTTLGLLTKYVYVGFSEPLRWAGVTMCSVFLIGLLVLPFAPETKGQPLPE
jgi:MFS family permease